MLVVLNLTDLADRICPLERSSTLARGVATRWRLTSLRGLQALRTGARVRARAANSDLAQLLLIAHFYDRDQAMTRLEQGYEERFNPGVLLRPGFDPLRSDPRFQALARRVGLDK